MSKRTMPKALKVEQPKGLQWEVVPQALERWTPDLMAAAASEESTISVLDAIGVDPWTGEGVTAKRIAAALRSIGADKDVVVNINSPGGDLFEGMAIYNLLREHQGKVTVKVLGLAASAASIVAMAGDEVLIARAGFLMIHDTWVITMGNRNDLRETADMLEPFDAAMADIYAARSGMDMKDALKLMDMETWIGGTAAVEQGFADGLLPADEVKKDASYKRERLAALRPDMVMAQYGMPRSARRALIQALKAGTPSAVGTGTPSAAGVSTPSAVDSGTPSAADASEYLNSIKNLSIKETT
jgi:ATP-dependent protease ClpP protease subunit